MQDAVVESAVRQLLVGIGENPEREGLRDTPARAARAWREFTSGNRTDPRDVLKTAFAAEGYDEMVTLRDVPFYSLCEHHLLPFVGHASIVYIPNGRVVGLSKLARLVDCFARRLQIQERMTVQIGEALQEHLAPRGYGVALRAAHMCMRARGVAKAGSEMVTTAVGGIIKDDMKARTEFVRLAGL